MAFWEYLTHHLLEAATQRHPDRIAVVADGQFVSYGRLEALAGTLATFLAGHGIEAGDRVAMLCENSVEAVVAYFGILKAGAVVVSLNAESTPENLRFMLHHSEAHALVAHGRHARGLGQQQLLGTSVRFCVVSGNAAAPSGGPVAFHDLTAVLAEGMPGRVGARRIDADLESIIYTSGSTGEPKGVMLSHLNTMSNMRSIAQYLSLGEADRIMVVLPFSYIYGKSLLLTHILVGGSVVIDNRFMYPNLVIDRMVETAVTGFAGVPSTFSVILARSKIRDCKIPSLRYVTQAGGAMPAAVQKQVAEVFHPARLYVMYGATEAAPRLTYVDPDDLPRKWGTIGKPIPNVDVFVADEAGAPVPRGETGEIVARGSNIMMGYWKDPEGTAAVLRRGLYFTGDLGTMDEEGFLSVVGRKRDILKVRGYRVSCKAIEEALAAIEGVQEAAVTGIADAVQGEAPCAFIVLAPGRSLTEQQIRQSLAACLRPFEIPARIEFRSELPKNPAGKVMKSQLTP